MKKQEQKALDLLQEFKDEYKLRSYYYHILFLRDKFEEEDIDCEEWSLFQTVFQLLFESIDRDINEDEYMNSEYYKQYLEHNEKEAQEVMMNNCYSVRNTPRRKERVNDES